MDGWQTAVAGQQEEGGVMANVHAFPMSNSRPLLDRWCSECFEQSCAQCDCRGPKGAHAKFVGKAKVAELAIEKYPEMTGPMLADKFPGISRKTFDRARERSTRTNDQVEKRLGKDGKYRKTKYRPRRAKPVSTPGQVPGKAD